MADASGGDGPDGETPDGRAEHAFRRAIETMPLSEGVNPSAARARAGQRRSAARVGAGLAVVVILVVGVLLVPRWVERSGDGGPTDVAVPAATGYRDPAPSGWRTEQYRGVTFQVPDSWGYGFEPGSDWCIADGGTSQPRRESYVALGSPTVVASIACPALPDRLVTEHVAAAPTDTIERRRTINGVWLEIGIVDGVEIRAYAADRALARRIAGSATRATADAPCQPALSIDPKVRPASFDLTQTAVTGDGIVCQYDVSEGSTVADLRAVAHLPRAELAQLVEDVAAAPRTDYHCANSIVGPSTEIALTVAVPTSARTRLLTLRAGSCGDQDSTPFGGFDDGLHVYRVTRTTCHAALAAPARLDSGSGEIGEACVGP